jgi:hypothetical protein
MTLFDAEWSFTGGVIGAGLVLACFAVEWCVRRATKWRRAEAKPATNGITRRKPRVHAGRESEKRRRPNPEAQARRRAEQEATARAKQEADNRRRAGIEIRARREAIAAAKREAEDQARRFSEIEAKKAQEARDEAKRRRADERRQAEVEALARQEEATWLARQAEQQRRAAERQQTTKESSREAEVRQLADAIDMLRVTNDAGQVKDESARRANHQHVALSFRSQVAGVTYENADGSSRQAVLGRCQEGEALKLVREPSNPYDGNAVGVRRSNGEQLGYLPKEFARQSAPLLDGACTNQAQVVRLESRRYYVACTIDVTIFNGRGAALPKPPPPPSRVQRVAARDDDEVTACERCANQGRYFCPVDGPRGIALTKYQAHRLCKKCQAVIRCPVCGDRG